MVQFFKNDTLELQMYAVAEPILTVSSIAKDEFLDGAFECEAFLLMLYDEKRMPFSERVPRPAFVAFVREALKNFPFTGNFETYLFVIRSIFGPSVSVIFTVPAPGKLSIGVAALAELEFDFLASEYMGGSYDFFNVVDDDGDQIIFIGLPGIDTEYELELLFSEIIPVGIFPDISLGFFVSFIWVDDDDNNIVDDAMNQLVFYETGV